MAKPIPPTSARRVQEGASDIIRYEGSSNRSNRWATLSQTQVPTNRTNTSEEKARRSQV
jgi:hypothetical protein